MAAHMAMPMNQYHALSDEKNTAIRMIASKSSTVASVIRNARIDRAALGEQRKHRQREGDVRRCGNRPPLRRFGERDIRAGRMVTIPAQAARTGRTGR